jgi:hypothetical protein
MLYGPGSRALIFSGLFSAVSGVLVISRISGKSVGVSDTMKNVPLDM